MSEGEPAHVVAVLALPKVDHCRCLKLFLKIIHVFIQVFICGCENRGVGCGVWGVLGYEGRVQYVCVLSFFHETMCNSYQPLVQHAILYLQPFHTQVESLAWPTHLFPHSQWGSHTCTRRSSTLHCRNDLGRDVHNTLV